MEVQWKAVFNIDHMDHHQAVHVRLECYINGKKVIFFVLLATAMRRESAPGGALPSEWMEAKAPDGRTYYYNQNGETTWQRPSAAPPTPRSSSVGGVPGIPGATGAAMTGAGASSAQSSQPANPEVTFEFCFRSFD